MMKTWLTIFVSLGILAGCSSTGDKAEQPSAQVEDRNAPKTVEQPSIKPLDSQASTSSTKVGSNPLKDLNSPLSQRSIYYDLDQYTVKDEYRSLLQAHAKYLADNPKAKLIIQGNCDERGSREYNLALGQKRSDGVKKALVLLGVKETQIESVSLGEEKPKSEGNDEAAWSQNRRADLVYEGE